MKLSVHYEGQCIIVPCGDGSENIEWLIDESIRRSNKLADSQMIVNCVNLEARLEHSHGILMKEDSIVDVLDDNAVIFIGMFIFQLIFLCSLMFYA